MAIAAVSGVSTSANGSSSTVASPAQSHASGNLIVVGVRWYRNSAQDVSSVADTAGNTYTLISSQDQASDRIELWYAYNVTGNASNVVTVTFTAAATYRVICVAEYSGVATSFTPHDVTPTGAGGGGSTTIATGSFSTSQTDELLLSFSQTAAIGTTWTPDTGYTSQVQDSDTICMLQHKIVSAAQSGATITATNSGTSNKSIVAATFRGATVDAAGINMLAVAQRAGAGATAAVNTTGADLIVVSVSEYSGTGAGLSDSKSNTWTALTQKSGGSGGNSKARIYYCAAPTVGSGHTFTWTGGSLESMEVIAVRGAHATPFDAEAGTTNGTQPGSITPSVNGCLVVCELSADTTATVPTINSGFTAIGARGYVVSQYLQSGGAYLIQSTAAAINPTWSDTGACVIAAFKPVGGGGGSAIKTINGLAIASVKTWNGLAIASVKTINGLA